MNEPKYKGVRAFGTRHHGNGKNGTLWGGEVLRLLVDSLMPNSAGSSLPKKEKSFFPISPPEKHAPSRGAASSGEKNSALAESQGSFSAPKLRSREPDPYKLWATSWTLRATIDAPAVRHNRLEWLVGQMFHQVSRSMAEQIAKLQFDQRAVVTKADWSAHQQEFLELWRGLSGRWQESLSAAERDQLQLLMTEAERDTFRIVRGYHSLAVRGPQPDFAISQANLGERLGVSKQYAGQIVARLVELGIVARTIAPIPRLRAAHYRWLLVVPAAASATSGAHQGLVPSPLTQPQPSPPDETVSPDAQSTQIKLPSPYAPVETPKPPRLPISCDQSTQGPTPPNPQKQSVEVRFLDHLSSVREVNFDLYRAANLRRGIAADALEANIERLQRASDRLVALRLAYRLDATTVSLTTPKGALPLSNFHHQLLKNVMKYGTLDFHALQLAVCGGRGGPQYADLKSAAERFVAVRMLTPEYRLNPDPDQPIS